MKQPVASFQRQEDNWEELNVPMTKLFVELDATLLLGILFLVVGYCEFFFFFFLRSMI